LIARPENMKTTEPPRMMPTSARGSKTSSDWKMSAPSSAEPPVRSLIALLMAS